MTSLAKPRASGVAGNLPSSAAPSRSVGHWVLIPPAEQAGVSQWPLRGRPRPSIGTTAPLRPPFCKVGHPMEPVCEIEELLSGFSDQCLLPIPTSENAHRRGAELTKPNRRKSCVTFSGINDGRTTTHPAIRNPAIPGAGE
jgi:hypothetical protein